MAEVVKCPACQSEISPDGKALIKRSARLVELEKFEKIVDLQEKKIEELEASLAQKKEPIPDVQVEKKPEGKRSWFKRS